MTRRLAPDDIDRADNNGAEPEGTKFGLLLTQEEAWLYTGLSRSAWYRLRSADKLPPPVNVYGTGQKWRRADLDAWVARLRPSRTRRASRA